MGNELNTLLDLLGCKQGWLPAAVTWMVAFRFALKPFFSNWLQTWMTLALQRVADTPEQDDDTLMLRLLASPGYRLFALVVDMIFSVKLPTTASFTALKPKV